MFQVLIARILKKVHLQFWLTKILKKLQPILFFHWMDEEYLARGKHYYCERQLLQMVIDAHFLIRQVNREFYKLKIPESELCQIDIYLLLMRDFLKKMVTQINLEWEYNDEEFWVLDAIYDLEDAFELFKMVHGMPYNLENTLRAGEMERWYLNPE